jgi:hypothetical protein
MFQTQCTDKYIKQEQLHNHTFKLSCAPLIVYFKMVTKTQVPPFLKSSNIRIHSFVNKEFTHACTSPNCFPMWGFACAQSKLYSKGRMVYSI